MKKIAFLLVFCVTLIFTGCSGDNGTTGNSGGSQSTGGYKFSASGVSVSMNSEADAVVDALGEPLSYFESESCAFKGLDKIYTYDGFQLTTYPVDDVDYVYSVVFTSDMAETPEGIAIGSTVDEMLAAYGEDYSKSGDVYTYTKDKSTLKFITENSAVVSVEYYAITD